MAYYDILKNVRVMVMKKKSQYEEMVTCGFYNKPNVYKIYEWNENSRTCDKVILRMREKSHHYSIPMVMESTWRPYTTFIKSPTGTSDYIMIRRKFSPAIACCVRPEVDVYYLGEE